MNIIKKHLDDDQYYSGEHIKTQIYLHHTVSSTFDSTYKWWQQTPEHVGTAYIIDKDGTIYEAFNPKCWAWQLGLGKSAIEKQAIGIELVNEGYLTKKNDKIYWLDGKARYRGKYITKEWREQSLWAEYPKEQFNACVDLVKKLAEDFNIEKNVITNHDFNSKLATTYRGVLSHCNVRQDKTDVSPAFDLDLFKLLTFPEVKPIDVSDWKPIE